MIGRNVVVFLLSVLVFSAFVTIGDHVLLSENVEPQTLLSENPVIAEMISMIDESKIFQTVSDLQSFQTRVYGYSGNTEAGTYLYNRLSSIPGLTVEYQGGSLRNVVATLPGVDVASNAVYIVGAHYDSYSSDPNNAPGATDNGGGVAIVLELARIMSQYNFRHTLKFALWNREEGGSQGSSAFVSYASQIDMNVSFYFNYDSSCYDPYDRYVLDIVYNSQSAWAKDRMAQLNTEYNIGFTLTYNVHLSCGSDHKSFWSGGYTAVFTHEENHGPAHTPSDTVDKVSSAYAAKNGQLGISVLAELAQVQWSAPLGDFDKDNDVDIFDLIIIAGTYGAVEGDTRFIEACDLNGNGRIDVGDVVIVAINYGKQW